MGHLFCYISFIKEKTAFADRFTDWQANAKIEWRKKYEGIYDIDGLYGMGGGQIYSVRIGV